jgi:amino acid adenylation domain-containing protein
MDVTSNPSIDLRRQRPGRMPRVGEEAGEHPASHGQRALWFLHRLDPESGAYNIAVAVRLLGEGDREPLRRAFQALVDRHPALRTTLIAPGGEPRQWVHERMDLDWRTEDASGWDEERLAARLSQEAFRPFDLETGPLLRVRLFAGASGGGVGDTILLVLHHAISDLWSITVLVRELGLFYSGQSERLSPPAVRYSDFVRWQEEQLHGPEGERLWAYWRERLAGSLPVLDLATDRPRPPVQTWRGLACPLRLAPDETAALKAHARERGATLFVLLLAGFDALLHRLTGQEDLLVGAPAAGRRARELAGVVGYFVNPVALRADLSGDPAWNELMETLSGTVPADLAHQGYPFPLLAERLVPERDPSRPPIFQAMLVHERAPARAADIARFALGEGGARLQLGDLEVTSIALRERRVLVDVTLAVSEGGDGEEDGGLTVSLQVNADLFDAATAERMLSQWRTLLAGAIAEPGRRLSELPLLSPEERSELLVERNRTGSPWPDDLLLHEPFEAQAERNPEAVALIWNDERISYGDLNRRANRIAHHLRGLGVGPEVRVGVHLRRSPELMAALLGVLKAGGAYVPLDPTYPAERLEYVSRDADVALVLGEGELGAANEDNPERLAGPGNLAYVLYTSGSTGQPKGCAVEHRSPVAFVSWAREVFPPEELAGVLAATSIGFDLSVFELFVPLSAGGCVILADDVLALPGLAAREEVRLVNTVPSAMAELERVWGLPAGVRTVNLAGEPLRRDLADRLYRRGVERVFNLYGPTEDTTYSTFTLVPREPLETGRAPAIGRPLANRRVYLLDRRSRPGNPVPDGVPGEIFLGGAGLARGYLGRPDLTAERFVPDAWSGLSGARLYATGDLARWRRGCRDEELELLGRIDHQVKIRGFRIEMGEIEAVLASHPDVLEAAVVVRESPGGDRRLVAYLASGVSPSPSELQRHLRRRLPDYMVPATFVRLPELPKTASGKVDRRALPDMEPETGVRTVTPPRNPAEEGLAALWSELLGRTEVGIHDSFFDLGGHSLLAARLVARVREEMGVDLPLAAVLASPTVAGLAERLDGMELSEAPPIRPVPRSEPLPLSYGQRQIWLDDTMRPGTALYNMPAAVELAGALDPTALESALLGIVRRHEALRAVFAPGEDEPVWPDVSLDEGGGALSREAGEGRGGGLLLLVDLGSLPPAVRTREADRLMMEEARRPFALASSLFLRALLLRLDEGRHRLVLTLHHIAADGGSFAVLARELPLLYKGEALPELALQYGDYAAWQRRWLTPERLAPRLAASRERLSDVPPLAIPGRQPAHRSLRGGSVSALLPMAELAAARDLARRGNATLPMLLLAAFSAVLARTTGSRRFAVGVPLANRGRSELAGMVGYLVNPVAVRVDVPAGGFRDLLAVVRPAALAGWTEEELPFELVVRELGAARGSASHPVFQVMHAHQEPPPVPSLPGLAARRLPLRTATAKLDLTLFTSETEAGLEMELEHALDAMPEAEASRLLSGLQTLLAEALADPGRPLFDLPVFADSERRQLTHVENTEGAMPPRTHTEEVLAGIWADLLGLPRIGVHADLFALGAHSLLATRVVSRLREALGIELPLGQVIERRTVAQLAEAVELARREAPAVRSEIPTLPRGGDLPLSYAQERLWFLDRLEPGSPAYNMPGAMLLRGRLDVGALRSAVAGLVARHEVLRTAFTETGGRPVARVREPAGTTVPLVDLSGLPGPARSIEERRLARAEARASFRLDEPPLLRARLLRLSQDEHLLLLTLHHIVCDGWSLSVLTREIAALYAGASLPPLSIQFADYAAWQRTTLSLEDLLTGWREHLAGAPATIELQTDRPRPEERGALGAVRFFSLSADLMSRLAAAGRERGATPFMVLFAGFQAVLHRLSGQDDLVVGTPIAGRTRIETEDLIGLFVNVLPVRARIDPDRPFTAALDRAREALLAAYARQELPFEKLVEALAPERALGRSPIFQVLFVLQNAPAPPIGLPGLELAPREAERPAAKLDLTLELRPDGKGLAEYDPALWDEPTVIRLLEAYERLLTAVAQDPDRPLAVLPLLAEAERHQVCLEWNDLRQDWGREGSLCLHELIAEQAARTPDAVAVEMDSGGSWTYAELLRRASTLAAHLHGLGAGPETVVAISADRSPELMAGLLGILQSGAAYLPLDPAYPRERLERMVEEAGASLLVQGEGMAELRTSARVVVLEGRYGEPAPKAFAHPDNLAYVIYTSGSTGRPKGAMNVHRAVVNRLLWARSAHGIGPADRVLQKTPIGFDVSVWELFLPLLAGARLVLARPGGHQDPDYLAGLIVRRQVTVAHFVPSLLQAFLEAPGAASGQLRRVIASGEALPPRLAARFGERLPGVTLDNLYGPTEAAVDVTAWSCTGEERRPVPIGRPVANVRIHLFDAGMRLVPIGAAGELMIGGVQVARGYLGRPDLTAERFVPDPLGEPGGRLYRTGDLARYRTADGAIEFLGRIDQQVKIRGVRIELPEIEAALGGLPGVAEAVVAVREDRPGDRRLVAWVVPSGAMLTAAELREGLARTLPAAMIPSAFVELSELPHLASGKLDRRALATAPMPILEGGEVRHPRTPVEELLVELWKDVLSVEQIGIEENFFDLGGHSLLAVQVISAVRSRLGVEVPLRRLFEAPTVASFARVVAEAETGSAEAIPRRPAGTAPLSFGQRRLWFLDRWEPGSAAYNLPIVLELGGQLDVPALARSLAEVARRHEVLRARYPADGDDSKQEAGEDLPALPVIDLTRFPAEAAWIAAEEARRPFDLQGGPVLRARLLRLPERHVLLLTVHHIAADGWSLGILVREMGALYAAFSAGLTSPLAEPRIQYADFAAWQRGRLRGETLDRLLAFWKEQLADAPAALELPTDRPRPAARRSLGGNVPFHLDAEMASRLKDGRGATLFMALLGGFGALLHRYTGDPKIVIGAPVAGRSQPETGELIGFFVNSLAFALDLTGNPTFAGLLARVRETALAAFAHEELPFERLVEELRPERDPSRTPVFQAMLALQNAPMPPLALPGLTVTPRPADSGTSKLDLLLSLTEVETGLAGELTYDSDLFDRTTAERLASHLKRLLAAAVDGDRRIFELPILGEAERHQLTHEWNDTAADMAGATLAELFSRQAAWTPDRPAVFHNEEMLTYGELDRRSDELACALAAQGIGPESRVGLLLGRSVGIAVALLGVWKAGAAWVPLDPAWPEERLRVVAADAGLAMTLTADRLESVGALSGVFPATSSDSLAYVLYTSGSTGTPKGTLIQQGSVLSFARALTASVYRGLDAPLRVSVNAPLTFDASVQQWVQLLTGHTLDIVPEEVRRDGAALLAWIGERRIEILNVTPAHLRMLLDAGLADRRDLALRRMLIGGEAIDPESWRALAARPDLGAWNVYGPTECTVDSTGCELETVPRPAIGRPLANIRAFVLDERMEPAPIGVPGHLHVGGAGLARGYLGRPDLTGEWFVPDPLGEPGGRLYRTGDRARLLADGTIEFLGRLDRQLKHLGVRIEPGEIEAALTTHPAVRAAVVALRGARLVAWIVGDPPSGLRSFLAARLPAALVPALFVPIEAVPLTAHGKVDLRALPEPEAMISEPAADGPRTPVEEVLAAIWSETLGAGPVGRHDSFFDLGGHSLLATQAVSRIRRSLGVDLPLRDLFEAPTVAALALRVLAAKCIPPAPPMRPVDRNTTPLSFAQERLWFLDRLEPGSAVYHIPAAVRLEGPLDPSRLAAALGGVVARHEALRTRFAEVDGRPVQIVEPAQPVPLPVIDLSGLPPAAREPEAERWISEEVRRPFDLGAGPLLRALLLRLGENDQAAVLTMHHIASDGWSRTVLLRDLTAVYGGAPLPPLPVQYADFSVWQREWLTDDVRASQLRWWRETLAGLPPRLDLPADRPRPAGLGTQGTRGAAVPVELSSSQSLSALARREGASLFMAVLAAFEALLGRYAGREDVAVGVPLAGRNREEIEELIGFFVNPVVMRLDLSGGPTFRELLARAREATLGASMHQDLPFELLVEALAPRRDLGSTPLFQVVLAFQNTPRTPQTLLDLPGITLSPLPAATGTSKFDLTLALEEDLSGALEYRTDLYDAPTVQRLIGHLDVLLAAAVADPDRRVDELPLLSGPERAQVLREWNDTAADHPGETNLYDLFATQAAATPDAVAVVQDRTVWTYAELRERAETLARHLDGLPPETRVAVLLDRCPLAVASILAVLAAGAVYVPLDPAWPRDRLAFLLADSRSVLLLTESRHLPVVPEAAAVMCLDTLGEQHAAPQRPAVRRIGGDALAYVMYTSGSTGVPKGVAVHHRGVVRLVRNTNYAAFGPEETVYQIAPLAFDASTFEIWGALLHGGRLVLAPLGVPSLDGVATAVETQGITTLWLTTGLFHVLAEQPASRAAFGRLRQILVGGDVLSRPHAAMALEALRGGTLTNFYGPTEGTTFSSFHPMRLPLHDRPVPIGRPIANTRMYVLDRGLRPLPAGVPGELYVGGDGIARGYLDRPDLTAERFVPDPFSDQTGRRLYRTGDLARRLPDGNVDFLGRTDNQVKIRGFRVEPGEVEAALLRLPEVATGAVLAVADAVGERSLAAFYTAADPSAPPSTRQLRERLQESLPAHLVPTAFFLRSDLPLNPNGKIDRATLGREASSAAPVSEAVPGTPRNPVEELVAGVWAEVLGVGQAGIHDDFFELGGHSLLAARAVSRLRESLGVEVPLRELFEAPTPAGVAVFVERALRGVDGSAELPAPPISPVRRDGPLVPSFAQERLWFLDRLAPGGDAYNVPWALRLRGRLDPAHLAAALGLVAARHEALRTVFGEVDGRPTLEPARAAVSLPVVDLSGLPEPRPERNRLAGRLAGEEARRPFDLARGPLLRATLVCVAAEEHHLLLTLHHAVCDGSSLPILVRETLASLRAAIEGRPVELPGLPIQYADYAAWQRRWLAGDVLDRELAWWRGRLAGAPTLLDLPLDRPRPRVRHPRGALCGMELSEDLTRALTGLGRRRGATLFMTLLAAFDLLLARHSGQDDLCVGFPVAGRNRIELEDLVGLFVNTLVARADLSGDPMFAGTTGLLVQVRERVLEAYAHQDVPFERLVEELAPRRDLSLTPLIQVLFVHQTQPGLGIADLPGLAVEPLDQPEARTAKLDLTLAVAPSGSGLAVTLDYDATLFDRATAMRLLGHWQTLLAGIVEAPEARLADLPLLTGPERAQLLEEWSGIGIEVESGACLHRLIEAQADRTPGAVALVCGDRELTYAELDAEANRLAHALRRLDAGLEVPVAVCLGRSADLVVALLAVLKAGAAYVPLDPRYPPARLALLLEDSRAAVLITERRWLSVLPDEVPALCLLEEVGTRSAGRPTPSDIPVDPGNLAYVIYTSGSTGRPKGVGIEHRSASALVAWAREAFPPSALEAVLAVTSVCFDLSVFEIFVPLATGGRVILVDDALAAAPGATLINTVPSAMAELVRSGSVPESAATLNLAGEPLPRPLADALHELEPPREVLNLYGPTETTTYSTMARMVRADDRPPAIGRPVAGDRVYLVDRHLRPVPAGVPGEVLIGGAGLARGYLGRPDWTALRFVPDPFGPAGSRLYRTGDLARWRPDGELELVGRSDDQVKLRGFRIEPGEVEAVLLTHPAVEEAAVVVRDARLVAYAAAPGTAIAELRAFLAERLPAYLVPSVLLPVAALPRTANGKVDRSALPSPEGRPEAMPTIPPSGPTEVAVARIWGELLGVSAVGVNESFFDLGGHSLLGAQLLARVRSELRVELPLQTLFEAPTVAALAAEIDRAQSHVSEDAIPRVTDGHEATELLSRLDELSDDEVADLLREMQEKT